jgi:3-mercaptopyruvate sulfurtransferase SseA
MDRGFTRVRPLKGGLDSWLDAGLPVDEETVVTGITALGSSHG